MNPRNKEPELYSSRNGNILYGVRQKNGKLRWFRYDWEGWIRVSGPEEYYKEEDSTC